MSGGDSRTVRCIPEVNVEPRVEYVVLYPARQPRISRLLLVGDQFSTRNLCQVELGDAVGEQFVGGVDVPVVGVDRAVVAGDDTALHRDHLL